MFFGDWGDPPHKTHKAHPRLRRTHPGFDDGIACLSFPSCHTHTHTRLRYTHRTPTEPHGPTTDNAQLLAIRGTRQAS